MNGNNTLNRLLLVNPLNYISCSQIHQYRIPRILNLMIQALDLAKRRLQTIPLSSIAIAACGNGDRVGESCVVAPESEFGKRGAAGEEVEDRAYDGLLFF